MRTYNHLFADIDTFCEFLDDIQIKQMDQVLVRIHSAIHTKEQIQELAEGILGLLPHAEIIGCSTMQVISDGRLFPKACLISLTVMEQAEVRTARVNCLNKEGEWKTGAALAEEVVRDVLFDQSGFLLIFFPLLYSKIEDFVETINGAGVSVRMLGGAAYMEDEQGNERGDLAYVLQGTEASGTEVVMALISSDQLHIYGDYVCGVEPVGKKCPIVSQGRYIDKIEDRKSVV